MNNPMEQLYREVMQDHYKNPRNKGLTNNGEKSHKRNPSCGDDITVEVEIKDGKLHVHHDGAGCLICCSSASVMCEVLDGKTIDEAKEMSQDFFNMLMGENLSDEKEENLDEASVYQGVSKFPARIKCAALPWKALVSAIDGDDDE